MTIVFFSIGGGVFIVAFLLFLLAGINHSLCTGINEWIGDNLLGICIVLSGIALMLSALSGWIQKKFRFFIATFMSVSPFMIGLVQGLYWITSSYEDSAFLSLFAFIIYAVVLAVEAIVIAGIFLYSMDQKKAWPMMLIGIAGLIFNLTFW